MGMLDVGVDVLDCARQLGIADRLLVSTTAADHPTLDDEHLNLVYNACDVGLNTLTGEGFGLVALEHGATGAAQVLPDHSACAELWRGAAHLLPIPVYGPASRGSLDYGLPRPADVAIALRLLADDTGQREMLSLRAHALATDPRFDWGSIAARWHSILAEA
jgi:glycosyltransferase involved in cell wall biosynthesis